MHRPPLSLLVLAGVSAVLSFGTFLWFGYVSFHGLAWRGSGDVPLDSALLPIGWETYRTQTWSVGYPSHLEVSVHGNGTVAFIPTGGEKEKVFFSVQEVPGTLSSIKIARATEGYPDPVDLEIANLPATKYTTGVSKAEFFLLYNDRLLLLTSDNAGDETVAIMLATFAVEREERR